MRSKQKLKPVSLYFFGEINDGGNKKWYIFRVHNSLRPGKNQPKFYVAPTVVFETQATCTMGYTYFTHKY